MKTKKTIRWVLPIFLPLVLSFLVYFATKDDISYLQTLERNFIIPPIVFPIVWTILYILMGLWDYFYEKEHVHDITITIYWVSVLVNLLFSFLLFTFHQILLASIDVQVLFFMVLYLWIKTMREKKKYAYLLVPYLLWLVVAFVLMLDLLVHQ